MEWIKDLLVGDVVYIKRQTESGFLLIVVEVIDVNATGGSVLEAGQQLKFDILGNILGGDEPTDDKIVPAKPGTKLDSLARSLPQQQEFEVHLEWLLEVNQLMRLRYKDIEIFSRANYIHPLGAIWFFKGCPVNEWNFNKICNSLELDPQAITQPYKSNVGNPKFEIGDSVVLTGIPDKPQIIKIAGRVLKNNVWFYYENPKGVHIQESELISQAQWRQNLQDLADRENNPLVLAKLVADYDCNVSPEKIQLMKDAILNANDEAIARAYLAIKRQ